MSKAYVPPHKRKEVPVSLKAEDFPSLAGNAPARAGAGGPSYISKAATIVDVKHVVEEKAIPTFVGKAFRKTAKEESVVDEEFEKINITSESGWVTKESKASKKVKVDSDWDGFDDY